jgi:Ni2+-binding GTPase involved in maturation of urease and hydrogenase
MSTTNPLHIYLVGGFLGSGKTTAIANACLRLINAEKKVAVITNDQGDQLVDSSYFHNLSINNAGVFNGCFCCNYNALDKHILELKNAAATEIVFAESVGSCTDLVATIAKPFASFHPEYKVVISVFADAAFLLATIKGNASFVNENIQYIFRKQLEEADILIINKKDLLNEVELNELKLFIENELKNKTILYQDSNNVEDIANWLKHLENFPANISRVTLEIVYDKYGAGEAALAWLDKKISLHTSKPVAINTAFDLIENIYSAIIRSDYVIGHLKFLLDDNEGWTRKISFTNSRQQRILKEQKECNHVDILINARVETLPADLGALVNDVITDTISKTGCRIINGKVNSFSPGYPKPTHRFN